MVSKIISENTATQSQQPVPVIDVQQTTCCIVGGGPAGVVLALMLARQGIAVTLLEAHRDFDRDFRGDTIHPSVLEIMEELGLAERLLKLPHTKLRKLSIQANNQQSPAFGADFSRLKTRYPYIMVLPQVKFLEFIIEETQQYPNCQVILGANVQELIEEDGKVHGVRYRGHGGWHEIRASLTVGADGRHSKLRQLAGFEAIETSPPMDVLWFRLPRHSDEAQGLNGRIGKGLIVAMLDRSDMWQIAYIIPKGGYHKLRAEGIKAFRQSMLEVIPEFTDRVDQLKDWSQIALLSVESSRLKRWYAPGLLLIGDAAHVMSPIGGVGINYAIQDAVVAANLLSKPLQKGNLHLWDLAEVQSRREFPTRIIQAFQALMQQQILVRAMNSEQSFKTPFFLRLPMIQDIFPRLIGFGVCSAHVDT